GEPRHFRSQRFLDLPETSWGWRQRKSLAGAGDLYDMTIHRIDFAMDLLGPLEKVCGAIARFAARDRLPDGSACEPSDVDDWSSLIGVFKSGAVGVWEGSTLMKGYHNNGLGYERAEVNASEGSGGYDLSDPNNILLARNGGGLEKIAVPAEFLVAPGSPRDPAAVPPSVGFRYDLVWEFVSAIVEGRDCVPSFRDGAAAQAVADGVLASFEKGAWTPLHLPLD
ncbi:MAG: Gfo/Idh/MocA family protein, partial [Planctomycetia bacterium]